MPKPEQPDDKQKAIEAVARGRRSRWIQRKGGKASGFYYVDHQGNRISDEATLERIKSLVIPPAWSHVRINTSAGGRVQCVGIDTTGRVQYKYHAGFSQKQQRKKFAKVERFGEHIPRLREVTNRDIMLDGLPREKVLAIAVRLINSLYFRVGTDKSVKRYRTYGLTTLRNDHLTVGRGGQLKFDFVGKSGVQHRKVLVDEELASLMNTLKNVGPKMRLFHYLDGDGKPRPLKPSDINRYIKEATSEEFSSKDFRTWGATLLAALNLAEIGPPEDEATAKKNLVRAIRRVAEELGNTPAVCRSSYIHPAVISAYEAGNTIVPSKPRRSRSIGRLQTDLTSEERELIELLRRNGG